MDTDWFFTAWGRVFRQSRAANMASQNDASANAPETTNDEVHEPKPPQDEPEGASETSDNGSDDTESANHGHEQSEAHNGGRQPSVEEADDEAETSETDDNENTPLLGPSANANGIAGGFHNFLHTAYAVVTTKAQVMYQQARDSVTSAIQSAKEKGFFETVKAMWEWMRQNPKTTAFVVIPLASMALTAIILAGMGFGPHGIAAGSAAAIIHSGIGNAVAGSLLSTCTSAMMGGYGAPIIFGGVAFASAAITAIVGAVLKRWKGHKERQMVLVPSGSSKTMVQKLDGVAEKVIFNSMVVAAFAVYLVKSWWRARRKSKHD